jgi:hypothetical protein
VGRRDWNAEKERGESGDSYVTDVANCSWRVPYVYGTNLPAREQRRHSLK